MVTTPAEGQRMLPDLLDDVRRARAAFRTARHQGYPVDARPAQQRLVAALTAYTDALTALRLPVPYALHDELRLYGQVVTAYHR